MHSPHPDIKIGETYNLRIHVVGKSEDFIIAHPITQNGGYATSSFLEILHKYAPSFTALPSEIVNRKSSIVNKHDPTRLFKKGDKVRVVKYKGRAYNAWANAVENEIFLVDENELAYCEVWLILNDQSHQSIDPAYLELVTPVEELESYKVWDTTFSFNVGVEDTKAVFYYGADMSTCPYTKEQAKAAAEAERDRLNAEWRKEQNND